MTYRMAVSAAVAMPADDRPSIRQQPVLCLGNA
jgi:hypothetical protein